MISVHRIIALMLLLVCISPLYAYTPQQVSGASADSTQKLQQLQTQIRSVENALKADKSRLSRLQNQLKPLDLEIGRVNEELRNIQSKVAQAQTEEQALKKQYQSSTANKILHENLLSELLVQTYKNLQNERWQMLLSHQDIAGKMRLNQYYIQLSQARKAEIQALSSQLVEIQLTAQKVEQNRLMLQQLQQAQLDKMKTLALAQTERQQVIAQINKKLNTNEKVLAKLKSERQSLEQVFKELKSGLASIPEYIEPALAFDKAKHKITFPIPSSSPMLMTVLGHQSKGAKKSYVQASVGTPVHAVYGGRVVFAEWLRGIGLLLIIDHGNGYMSLYGNNDILYKSVGDWVHQAEMIARVGQSGGHSKPGLYFELRKDGIALNPEDWFNVS